MFRNFTILSALVLSTTIACGGGPSEVALDRPNTGGAAGAGGETSAGGANTGGTNAGGTNAGGTNAGGTNAGGTNAGGTSAGGAAGSGGSTNPNALHFENVGCTYTDAGAPALVDDSPLTCTFDVKGDPTRQVTLSCEDTQGQPVNCGLTSPTSQIFPFGPQPLPLSQGMLIDWPVGFAGKNYEIVMVANDGVEIAKHALKLPVVADDQVNVAPSVEFDCAGDTDGKVSVTAGQSITCTIEYRDPDPGVFDYSLQRIAGLDPVWYVSTESGGAYYTRVIPLTWNTDATEAGTSATYELWVDDHVSPILKKTIVIDVQ